MDTCPTSTAACCGQGLLPVHSHDLTYAEGAQAITSIDHTFLSELMKNIIASLMKR